MTSAFFVFQSPSATVQAFCVGFATTKILTRRAFFHFKQAAKPDSLSKPFYHSVNQLP